MELKKPSLKQRSQEIVEEEAQEGNRFHGGIDERRGKMTETFSNPDYSPQSHDLSKKLGKHHFGKNSRNKQDQEHVFEVIQKVGMYGGRTKFHIMRCVPDDLPKQESVRLSVLSCTIACLSVDIMLGRLSPRLLDRYMLPEVEKKLLVTEAFMQKYAGKDKFDLIDSHETKNFPVIPRLVNTMVVNPNKCESIVILAIGNGLCCATVVVSRFEDRWMCTHCDIS